MDAVLRRKAETRGLRGPAKLLGERIGEERVGSCKFVQGGVETTRSRWPTPLLPLERRLKCSASRESKRERHPSMVSP